jgi:hypothetical protein
VNRRERRRRGEVLSTPGGDVAASYDPIGARTDPTARLTGLAQQALAAACEGVPELRHLELVVIVTDRKGKAQGLGFRQEGTDLSEKLARAASVMIGAVGRIVQLVPEFGAIAQREMLKWRGH